MSGRIDTCMSHVPAYEASHGGLLTKQLYGVAPEVMDDYATASMLGWTKDIEVRSLIN